jgi:hypothetical protein
MGFPIEESVVQLAPAAAVMVTAVVVTGRTGLGGLRRRLGDRPRRALLEAFGQIGDPRRSNAQGSSEVEEFTLRVPYARGLKERDHSTY